MISVWFLIPAFFGGVLMGLILMGLCQASRSKDIDKKKWWEDE